MSLPAPVRKRRMTGQGLVEVAIVLFLVAIGATALVTLFGDNIRGLFGSSAKSLTGEPVANPGQVVRDAKWNMKGGSVNPYDTGSCGVTGCSTTGP